MSPKTTAYMANPDSVSADGQQRERRRTGDLRDVVPGTFDVSVLGGRCDPGAAQGEPMEGDGHEQQSHGQDQVRVTPSHGPGQGGGDGREDGAGQAAGEGERGQRPDAARTVPAGECGEGGLVERRRHGDPGDDPAGSEHHQVGGSRDGDESGGSGDRPDRHHGAGPSMVEDPADGDARQSRDDQAEGEAGGDRGGRPPGVGGDGWREDREGVVEDAPAGDLGDAQRRQRGGRPRAR